MITTNMKLALNSQEKVSPLTIPRLGQLHDFLLDVKICDSS